MIVKDYICMYSFLLIGWVLVEVVLAPSVGLFFFPFMPFWWWLYMYCIP